MERVFCVMNGIWSQEKKTNECRHQSKLLAWSPCIFKKLVPCFMKTLFRTLSYRKKSSTLRNTHGSLLSQKLTLATLGHIFCNKSVLLSFGLSILQCKNHHKSFLLFYFENMVISVLCFIWTVLSWGKGLVHFPSTMHTYSAVYVILRCLTWVYKWLHVWSSEYRTWRVSFEKSAIDTSMNFMVELHLGLFSVQSWQLLYTEPSVHCGGFREKNRFCGIGKI